MHRRWGRNFRSDFLEAQWGRALGHAPTGSAEYGECLALALQIRAGGETAVAWDKAWSDVANKLCARAEALVQTGDRVSARECYLRASNYYRTAYTPLLGMPGEHEARTKALYGKHREAFDAAITLWDSIHAERVSIPYENGLVLHGWVCRPASASVRRNRTLVINGGYDSTAEEAILFSGLAAVARGYTCVVFDGPGQGRALFEQGLKFRPDWEAVVSRVVDFMVARDDVDASKVALLGISFGGYLAPRAAAFEPRLAALVADPGEISLFREFAARMPPFALKQLNQAPSERGGLRFMVLNHVLNKRAKSPEGPGWAMRRGMFVHGMSTPFDYLVETKRYTLEEFAGNIKCPTLVCRAEADHIGVTAPVLFDALTGAAKKEYVTFLAAEGAGEHCEGGARSVFNAKMFEFLNHAMA